jgi:hypothetical protein
MNDYVTSHFVLILFVDVVVFIKPNQMLVLELKIDDFIETISS